MAELHNLPRPDGSHRARKRLGQGPGSGTGKTAGKGHKGSRARAGHHGPGGGKPHYEGGQMPLQRRLPKRGFTPLSRTVYQVVNLYQLEALGRGGGDAGDAVRARPDRRRPSALVKVLAHRRAEACGEGQCSRIQPLGGREKIQSAGGSAEELG